MENYKKTLYNKKFSNDINFAAIQGRRAQWGWYWWCIDFIDYAVVLLTTSWEIRDVWLTDAISIFFWRDLFCPALKLLWDRLLLIRNTMIIFLLCFEILSKFVVVCGLIRTHATLFPPIRVCLLVYVWNLEMRWLVLCCQCFSLWWLAVRDYWVYTFLNI